MPEYEIECRNLTKRFGEFTAVDDVSFGVGAGEIFGFLGPNGSGKSTTIRMICGILTPTLGSSYVAGLNVQRDPEGIKQCIGYMSQKFSLYDDLTVAENLEFFAGMYGLRNKSRRARIDAVLGQTALDSERDSLVSELSTGVRQKLALAASILHSPAILILDEPTSGVDPLSRRRFWDLIYDLAASKVTILVTTHSMDEAEHCHRLAMMQSGKLVCVGAPDELKRTQIQGEIFSISCQPLFPALAAVQDLEDVADASVYGSRLHVRGIPGRLQEAAVREALEKASIKVESVEPGDATLEDVFVSVAEEAKR